MISQVNICLVSLGGTFLPYGNIVNDSKKFGNSALEYLSSYLSSANYNNEIYYFTFSEKISQILNNIIKNNVFVFYADLLNYKKIFEIASLLKKHDASKKIILIGKVVDEMHVKFLKEHDFIDFCLLGNPNESFKFLLDNEFKEEIVNDHSNIATKRNSLNKKCNTSFDKDLFPNYKYYRDINTIINMYKTYPLTSQKQVCYCSCSFCWSEKGKYIYKSVSHLIQEIAQLLEFGITDFVFIDNDFFDILDDKRIRFINDLCNEILLMNKRFSFSVFSKSKNILKIDNELLLLLKKCGMYCVFLGVDAGNQKDKDLYKKKSSLEEDLSAISKLKNCNIFFRLGFIGINPYSSLDTLKENYYTLSKISDSNIYHYLGLKLMLLPGTALYKQTLNDYLIEDPENISNVYGYKFKDPSIEKTICFLDSLRLQFEQKKFIPLISLQREYERGLIFNDAILLKYQKIIRKYTLQEFKDINKYFHLIYVKQDLDAAVRLKDEFSRKIIDRAKNNGEYIKDIRRMSYGISDK